MIKIAVAGTRAAIATNTIKTTLINPIRSITSNAKLKSSIQAPKELSNQIILNKKTLIDVFSVSSNTNNSIRRSINTNATIRTSCPFEILGIPKSSSYAHVKKTFLKLAMHTHPDVSKSSSTDCKDTREKQRKRQVDLFIQYRNAFESIVELDDGSTAIRREAHSRFNETPSNNGHSAMTQTEEEFQSWFHAQTGHRVPYDKDVSLDPNLIREVVEVTENMAQGGLDKGGMWEFAARIREQATKEGSPPLRVAGGEEKVSRRRRKK